jgi:hypothetical protein
MSLAEAASRLAKGIRMQLRDLDEEDSKSYGSTPRTLDLRAFNAVIGQVTEWAINRVTEDWGVCKQAISTDTNQQLASEQCECELLLRFSLLCKHHILHACATGIPIPRSLFHPRWWLDGPPISKASHLGSRNIAPRQAHLLPHNVLTTSPPQAYKC